MPVRKGGHRRGRGPLAEMLEDRLLLSTTWFVDNSLARSGDGTTLAKAFSTISRGISAAHDGDIVVVEPGSYHDNLRINKPIRLVGSGAGCTTLTAASGGAAAVSIGFHHSDTGIITTPIPQVILDSLTIVEGSSSAGCPVEIRDGANNVTIGHCVLDASSSADAAIAVDGHADNLTFFSDVFRYGRTGIAMPGSSAENSRQITISENEFCPTCASGGEVVGVKITHAADVIIAENTWHVPVHSPTDSIAVCAARVTDVTDLSFCQNVICGIDANTNCTGLDLHGCKGTAVLTCNEFRSLLCGATIADIDQGPPCAMVICGRPNEGNYFFANGTGLCIPTGDTAEIDSLCIAGNTFRQNTTALEIGSAATAAGTDTKVGLIWVHDNDFDRTNGAAIRSFESDATTDRIAPQSNWFGATSGATHPSNPAGTGAVVKGQFKLAGAATTTAAPRCDLAAHLDETACTLPSISVPGDCGQIPVDICNLGDLRAAGSVQVQVFLSTDSLLDASDILVASRTVRIRLSPGCQCAVPMAMHIREIPAGSYFMICRIVPGPECGVESSLDNNVAVATLPTCIQWSCGAIPGRRARVLLTVTNPATGNPVTFRLAGPGMATVDSSLNVTVDNSASNTSLFVQTTHADRVNLGNVTFNGAVGAFIAPRAELTGSLSVTAGPAGLILLDTISGPRVDIFGAVGLLEAAQITGGAITVDTISALEVTGRRGSSPLAGNFSDSLTANNFAQRRVGVGLAYIAGDATNGSISVQSGALGTALINGWMQNFGIFAAGDVCAVYAGAMVNSAILAGSNADHTGLAASTMAHLHLACVTGQVNTTGVSFANTVLGAAVVDRARLANVSPNNAASTPPKGVDFTPAIPNDFGVFVTASVGVVEANLPGARAVVVRTLSDTPVFAPDFFVRLIPGGTGFQPVVHL